MSPLAKVSRHAHQGAAHRSTRQCPGQRGAVDLRASIADAPPGRIDTLFVAEESAVWGQPGDAAERIRIDRESTPDNEDLTDDATVQTLLHGGNVHLLPASALPREAALAATLRF